MERIHYSNGMAIYDKRLWEARLEYGHLLTLTREGETLTFLSQTDEKDQDKECYKAGPCLDSGDLLLVAKFLDGVNGMKEGRNLEWEQLLSGFFDMNPLGPCILHYPSRRAIWMGSGWNMLRCNVDDRYAQVSLFGTDPGEITNISGDMAVPRMLDGKDFGFLRVTTYGVSIEHYM